MRKTPAEAVSIIRLAIEKNSGYMWGSDVAMSYVPSSHARFAELHSRITAPSSGTVIGLLMIDIRSRHPDSLSVSGGYAMRSTDTHAVATKTVRVLAGEDGSPDIERLCRDGGPVAKALAD